jgi:hypothetical protein
MNKYISQKIISYYEKKGNLNYDLYGESIFLILAMVTGYKVVPVILESFYKENTTFINFLLNNIYFLLLFPALCIISISCFNAVEKKK